MAGASSCRLPVISATISITAIGACAMLPKQAIIPTTTNGAGVLGTPGRSASSRHAPAPRKPPITMPGPKMPPEPPEPIDSEVARILANGRSSTIHSGIVRSRGPIAACTHPYPVPRTCGTARAIRPTRSPPSAGLSIRLPGSRFMPRATP
jgi:hypothetical protein